MALPGYVFEEARANAAEHVQIEIVRLGAIQPWAGGRGLIGECTVEGRIARTFRGRLKVGEPLRIAVSCAEQGAEIPAGGTVWTDMQALRNARVLEAYLDWSAQGPRVVRDQVYIVPAVRAVPYCGVSGCTISEPSRPRAPGNPLIALWERLRGRKSGAM